MACAESAREIRAADSRPNILLISMDTTRSDHLSVYGYERPTSPNLEALAAEGVIFKQAYAPTSTTGPTHASVFTSLYPRAHGVVKNGLVLASRLRTLAEILTDEGFETGAVVSSYVLNRRFGYSQGFGHYDDDLSESEAPNKRMNWVGMRLSGKFYGTAEDTTRRAANWLETRSRPEHPFFLFVHYFDPHFPYEAPARFQVELGEAPDVLDALDAELRREIEQYDRVLAYTDHEIGQLLEILHEAGVAEDTLVVVMGDHGEGLMQHGHMHHGKHIYEEAVRVPLLLRWPRRWTASKSIEVPTQLMDLAPTLLDIVGAELSDAPFQGESIAASLGPESEDPLERPVFLYRRPYRGGQDSGELVAKGEKFGVRLGRWKLIDGPAEGLVELFDLEADPREIDNLVAEVPQVSAGLLELLREWRQGQRETTEEATEPTEEDRARLRALGYVD